MREDNKDRTNSVISELNFELQEAQVVLTSKDDITCVTAWLSKEGTLYFRGRMGSQLAYGLEKELKAKGYHVKPRFSQ